MNQPQRAELLFQGAEPSLRSWLDLAWFYPPEFQREFLFETPRSLIVIGATEVIKFRKPGLGASRHFLPFAERWRSAVREILANAETAPGVYQGLRTFRYHEDELIWCEDAPLRNFSLADVPEADEVALSLSRLPSEEFLPQSLREDIADADRLSALAERLSWFYRSRAPAGSDSMFEQFVSSQIDNMRETLRMLKEENFVNPRGEGAEWEGSVLSELRSWMESAISRCESELLSRAEKGCVREAHGALYAEHICVPLQTLSPVIIGRSPAQLLGFRRDVLGDLATLRVDLHVQGYAASAELLLSSLCDFDQQLFDVDSEVLDLFSVHTALEEILRRSWIDSDPSSSQHKRDTAKARYLQFAYRTALGLNRRDRDERFSGPPVIVFEGERKQAKGQTAWLTAQLIGAEFLGFAADDDLQVDKTGAMSLSSVLSGDESSEFATLFELATSALRGSRPIVVECRTTTREGRLMWVELAEKFSSELLWIRCFPPASVGSIEPEIFGASGAGLVSAGQFWDEQILQRSFNLLPLELSLSPLASAKLVLHQIRHHLARNN